MGSGQCLESRQWTYWVEEHSVGHTWGEIIGILLSCVVRSVGGHCEDEFEYHLYSKAYLIRIHCLSVQWYAYSPLYEILVVSETKFLNRRKEVMSWGCEGRRCSLQG